MRIKSDVINNTYVFVKSSFRKNNLPIEAFAKTKNTWYYTRKDLTHL